MGHYGHRSYWKGKWEMISEDILQLNIDKEYEADANPFDMNGEDKSGVYEPKDSVSIIS